MTPKTFSQKSQSDTSNDKVVSIETLLKDVKKADDAKKITSGSATDRPIKVSVLTSQSTPAQILEILKSKFDLNTKPSIEYIDHVMGLDDLNRQKIQAVLCVLETDLASQDIHVFEKVGTAFNNRIPRFDHMVPLSPGECAWAVKSIQSIRHQDMSDEVCFYIACSLYDYGLILAPESLSFVQNYLDKFTRVTDTADLYKLYKENKKSTGVEFYDRQLEKMLAIDTYVNLEANV